MGFTSTFGDGKCIITLPADGECVAQVPKNAKGLYRVEHEPDSANAVTEKISIDQLHRQLGHISPDVARRLVNNKLVAGVRLKETTAGNPFFCESCVYAKATRKSVPKRRKGEQATEFGGEIHTDIWGPAPVELRGGKRYYVTYTDDKNAPYQRLLPCKEVRVSLSPTKTTKRGVRCSSTPRSSVFTQIKVESTRGAHSSYISDRAALRRNARCTIPPQRTASRSAVIAQS